MIDPASIALKPSSLPRAAFYIDGFNFYHALDDLRIAHLKWVNWRKLAEMICGNRAEIIKIAFFTAPPRHRDQGAQDRYRKYIEALTAYNVDVHKGYFLTEKKSCRTCLSEWNTFSEKEGDVGLAVSLIEDAYENVFDLAYLVSSDGDQGPTLRSIREKFGFKSTNPKRAIAVFPQWRGPNATNHNLANYAASTANISKAMLEKCLLPERIPYKLPNGEIRIVYRPAEYEPPAFPQSN